MLEVGRCFALLFSLSCLLQTAFAACAACPPVANPKNGEVSFTNGTQNGSVAEFICDPGYRFANASGASSLNCVANVADPLIMEWDAASPTCVGDDCPRFESLVNGISATYSTSGNEVFFSCAGGYERLGEAANWTAQCVPDDASSVKWDQDVPTCKKCAQGKYAFVGATACSSCNRGSFAPAPGSTECKACDRGFSCGGTTITRFTEVTSAGSNVQKAQKTCERGSRSYLMTLDNVTGLSDLDFGDVTANEKDFCKEKCKETEGCTHVVLYAETVKPTAAPTVKPTYAPTHAPTSSPTRSPTSSPTSSPTRSPTSSPTSSPSASPSTSPSASPSASPTSSPSASPSTSPSASPSASPTSSPSASPSTSPSASPTSSPTRSPVTGRRRLLAEGTKLSVHCDLCRVDDETLEWYAVFTQAVAAGNSFHVFEGVRGEAIDMTECAPGKYSAVKQNPQCQPCPGGRIAAKSGATACDECPRATFSAEESSGTACTACASGKFANVRGSARCFTCAENTYLEACELNAATGNVSCPDDEINDENRMCWPCPLRGVKCGGTPGKITIESGYWYDFSSKLLGKDTQMYACQTQHCIGDKGDPFACQMTVSNVSNTTTVSSCETTAGFECKKGHTGRLCSSCELKSENYPYGWAKTGLTCTECIPQSVGVVITVFLVLIILFIVAWTVGRRVQSALKRAAGGRGGSVTSSVQRIFMTYAQMMSILSASKMQPPEEVTRITASTSSFTDGVSAQAYPVQCAIQWGYYDQVLFYFLSPFVAIITMVFLVAPAMWCFQKHVGRRITLWRKEKDFIQKAAAENAAAEAALITSSQNMLPEVGSVGTDSEKHFTPSHWRFIDANGYVQGPCSVRQMKSWLMKGNLEPDVLIIANDEKGAWVGGKWRYLRDIHHRIEPISSLSSDDGNEIQEEQEEQEENHFAPQWMFVDSAEQIQGPCDHVSLVSRYTDGHFPKGTWVALVCSFGSIIGEWRLIESVIAVDVALRGDLVGADGALTMEESPTNEQASKKKKEEDTWELHYDKDGNAFYCNTRTSEAQWATYAEDGTVEPIHREEQVEAEVDEVHNGDAAVAEVPAAATGAASAPPRAGRSFYSALVGDRPSIFGGVGGRSFNGGRASGGGARDSASSSGVFASGRGSIFSRFALSGGGTTLDEDVGEDGEVAGPARRGSSRLSATTPARRSRLSMVVYDSQFSAVAAAFKEDDVREEASSPDGTMGGDGTHEIDADIFAASEGHFSIVDGGGEEVRRTVDGGSSDDDGDKHHGVKLSRITSFAMGSSSFRWRRRKRATSDEKRDVISRKVLGSMHSMRSIKSSDIDRMIKRYGTPVRARGRMGNRDEDELSNLDKLRQWRENGGLKHTFATWKGSMQHRREKGIKKREILKERVKQAERDKASGGEWLRYFDLDKKEVYFVNSVTRERREKAPSSSSPSSLPSAPQSQGEQIQSMVDEYELDNIGFRRLQRHLEKQQILIAILTTLVIIIYFMYMRVTRSLLEVYSLTRIDGQRYVTRSLEDKWDSPQHMQFMVGAGFAIVLFTILMPIVGFGILVWMHRTGREHDPRWRTAVGFLNDGYKDRYYWWEAAVLLRKLALLLVADVLSPDDGFLQSFLAVALLSVAMVVQAWVQPYETTTVNVLDITAMGAVYVTRLGAILFAHFDPKDTQLPQSSEECRDNWLDFECKDNRERLGSVIGYSLIAMQVLLVVLFGVAMMTDSIKKKGWCVGKGCCTNEGCKERRRVNEEKKKKTCDTETERDSVFEIVHPDHDDVSETIKSIQLVAHLNSDNMGIEMTMHSDSHTTASHFSPSGLETHIDVASRRTGRKKRTKTRTRSSAHHRQHTLVGGSTSSSGSTASSSEEEDSSGSGSGSGSSSSSADGV